METDIGVPLQYTNMDANNRPTEEDHGNGNEMLPAPFAHFIQRPHHQCNSVQSRTVNECNKLSADCVHSSSINMFKNRIDNYLVRAGYT